ncbi:bifunctional diaminohydroxyphosphoribosylaminopyrimidine deaminase/5-amino-6-(5-phosphoribosylamino)uracil reductase RibD [Falsirhodobacter halotolerans]|uniref:bifunctional diaminohydroxyphosphoribosylaminopyrimidine deaminase/5-amino-6-(5-phosphoribosylamino)uracil reductase RibD n=1 Tax=Falsirhodobacter halotolerans TaxID=1146892 RepID=UPI001FD2C79B|nr:bifunctional diaminohydroxyphosphoribosylaminopyrimidine deaminase/5-amino-6-(5-phosphoribosylamino)uracil reductase RibD [Falsirhodobacter halotolerans]MCJ8139677.1 bifunctional diaminohydroxyphosphoribosylaminopyrimidine deaminase/5-amino-6-(5-phosphoribosylamino)uracil reductase RibD [Falsirhodobacter halotolerans]
MAHAIGLARRGLGNVWPNPAVGCVIVREGRIVGRGWTQPGGRPHAEVRALEQAGPLAEGATAYVSLEPCAHFGKTPPCSAAIVRAGVSHVVSAAIDPDPRVAGRGHAMLRAAGITVTEHVMADQARALNKGFLKRIGQGLPMVTLKLATSLDGRIATAAGESRWITGAEARRAVHAIRLSHDAVMIGSGTALADDPELSVRDIGARHQPVRVVLDSTLRLDPGGRLGRSVRKGPVWMVHGDAAPQPARDAWIAAGAHLIQASGLRAALRALADRGITRVFSEGGATVAAALLREGLVDDLAMFTAGAVLGGDAVPAIAPLGWAHLADAPRPTLMDQRVIGGDTLTRWSF